MVGHAAKSARIKEDSEKMSTDDDSEKVLSLIADAIDVFGDSKDPLAVAIIENDRNLQEQFGGRYIIYHEAIEGGSFSCSVVDTCESLEEAQAKLVGPGGLDEGYAEPLEVLFVPSLSR